VSDDALELRLRRLEAREEIHALLHAYRRALDDRDFEGYAALFGRTGQFVGPGWTATGHDEIVAMLEGLIPEDLFPEPGHDRHLISNIAIDVLDDDTARSRCTWLFVQRWHGDRPRLQKMGRYLDELHREDGRWRFARRRAPMIVQAAHPRERAA
jgi:uncharacterized protein (TIGR02246 family)